ncbi:MAG: competence/damage-inducible protein A [Saprospiraceae bacterium]
MKVQIVTVGDEILIGQIIDTNSAWMGQQLNLIGARVVKKTAIGDVHDEITAAITEGFANADIVLMTGGLGPTKDDITKKAIADYFGVAMQLHQPTYDQIKRFFEKLGRQIPEDALQTQCLMPTNATLLTNKMGTAPGMWFEHENKVLVSMPGVPYEMEYLMENEVLPRLKARFPGKPIAHRTLLTVGEGESNIAKRIENFENSLPANIKLAYLPAMGQVRLRLTGTGAEEMELHNLLDTKAKELEGLIPELVFGYGDVLLEQAIGEMLRVRQLTFGTAESCTGGYVAHRITSIPGSSDYFQGSIVSYSNELKMKLLNVNAATLEQYGAVSEQTVTEMVQGALDTLNVDVALAISGIAGPGGGTPEKPVGLVWLAIGNRSTIKTRKVQSGRDRLKNIQYSGTMALNLIRQFLQETYKL